MGHGYWFTVTAAVAGRSALDMAREEDVNGSHRAAGELGPVLKNKCGFCHIKIVLNRREMMI